jgi:hypothetical protein
MADLQVIVEQFGPAPLSVQFNAPADGPVTFFLSGSAWANTANQLIGVSVELDGVPIGTAVVFCNESTSHRALVPVLMNAVLTAGVHTITILPNNAYTVTDGNDYFQVALLY